MRVIVKLHGGRTTWCLLCSTNAPNSISAVANKLVALSEIFTVSRQGRCVRVNRMGQGSRGERDSDKIVFPLGRQLNRTLHCDAAVTILEQRYPT